jgi:hypothetical protein
MGMFDDIIVPKSYLKDILDKKEESLFDTYHKFQTKDLENSLAVYKVYRNQLYKQSRAAGWGADVSKPKWDKTTTTAEIGFYDTFSTKDGDECWFEFKFKFVKGKLDSKELVDKVITNKESREAIDRMWDIEQSVFEEYRQRWSYKFWTRVEHFCQKLSVMARKRHSIPYSLRETAYKTSGRLKRDPDCLEIYVDN